MANITSPTHQRATVNTRFPSTTEESPFQIHHFMSTLLQQEMHLKSCLLVSITSLFTRSPCVLQFITVYYGLLRCITVYFGFTGYCSVLQCITDYYDMLWCITVVYSSLQFITVYCSVLLGVYFTMLSEFSVIAIL